jgi:hypothetical protein
MPGGFDGLVCLGDARHHFLGCVDRVLGQGLANRCSRSAGGGLPHRVTESADDFGGDFDRVHFRDVATSRGELPRGLGNTFTRCFSSHGDGASDKFPRERAAAGHELSAQCRKHRIDGGCRDALGETFRAKLRHELRVSESRVDQLEVSV